MRLYHRGVFHQSLDSKNFLYGAYILFSSNSSSYTTDDFPPRSRSVWPLKNIMINLLNWLSIMIEASSWQQLCCSFLPGQVCKLTKNMTVTHSIFKNDPPRHYVLRSTDVPMHLMQASPNEK